MVGEEEPSMRSQAEEGRNSTWRKVPKSGGSGRDLLTAEASTPTEEEESTATEEQPTTEVEVGEEGTWDRGRGIPFADRATTVPSSATGLRVVA